MKKILQKFFHKLSAFVLALLAAVALCVPAVSRIAKAEEHPFDSSDVMEDLSEFDFSLFPAIDGKDIQLVRFTEYGFSSSYQGAYGLYVYIYNPSRTEISSREGANTINIATRYKDGEPYEYANVDLKLCNYSTGVYSRLLYKFKVVGEELEKIYANARASDLSNLERRYDVAGIQCWETGAATASLKVNTAGSDFGQVRDYSISRTYYFTGYAKGYGPGAENASTLSCRYDELTTLDLDIQHTNWRNDTTYKDYTYEEVNSVYFSIPNEVLEKYGSLKKIKAEWFEYKTQPIFVTSDENAYKGLLDWIGEDVGECTEANPWRVWWEETVESYISGKIAHTWYSYSALYNEKKGNEETYGVSVHYSFLEAAKSITSMNWLFYRDDPETLKDYEVTRAEVETWAKKYSDDYKEEQGTVEARKSFYAKGLFADSVDKDRLEFLEDKSKTSGYVEREISADEKVNLLEYKNQSWWEKFTGKKKTTTTAGTYDSIYLVQKKDLDGDADDISENLFINERDVDEADGTNNKVSFRDYCKNALDNDQQPVLFRFANTDYYASAARFDKRGNGEASSVDGYVCQQTCFLDFDIISLTFEKGDTENVLAVVADPIDIFNGTTPPPDLQIPASCFNFKKVFRIVFLVLVFLFCWKIYRKLRDSMTLAQARRDHRQNQRQKRNNRKKNRRRRK